MSTDQELTHRLNRLQGQLQKLQEEIIAEADCARVIPQFLAVKGAIAGAFETYVKQSLHACATQDTAKIERLLALLVRS